MLYVAFADQRWLSRRLASQTLGSRIRFHLWIVSAALIWLGAVFVASYLDNTLSLPGVGKGFLEHGGYIALHLATPLALSLSLLGVDLFARLLTHLDNFLSAGSDKTAVHDLRDRCLDALNLKSRWAYLLLLFIIVGALCSTLVLCQVVNPISTYGNDVFNACRYPFGYYVANLYLALSWTVVFPVSLFFVLCVTAALVLVLHSARSGPGLTVDLLHPDNCGGLAEFGNLNLILMCYYVPPFLAMTALAETHIRKYASLLIPAMALSLVFLAQSIVGVYAIHTSIRSAKRRCLASLHPMLSRALEHPAWTDGNSLPFLLWQHIRSVRTMPYAENVRTIVNVLRYLPPLLTAAKLISVSAHLALP